MKTINTFLRLHHNAVAIMLVFRVASLTMAPSLVAASSMGVSTTVVAQAAEIETNPLSEDAFILETNNARRELGLAPLTLNKELISAAEAKANDMKSQGYWDHFRPGDKKAGWDFIAESGYAYHYAGENLARGYQTAHGITEAWLASPSHRANLLSDKYTEVGFATVVVPNETSDRALLTVQLFASK